MWDPKREPLDQCTTAEKFAKYANGGSLSMCQIESVAFGINQCHHSDGIVPAQRYKVRGVRRKCLKFYELISKIRCWIKEKEFGFDFHS